MLAHAQPRQPLTRRTATTAQRLGHRSHAESGLDWGSIFKLAVTATALLGTGYYLLLA